MKFQHSLDINAKPADIYKLYADVAGWRSWDPEVEEPSLEGDFVSGSVGTIKPKGGPKSEIKFVEVRPDTFFMAQCRLPLCLMTFEHELVPNGASTTVTHKVSFSGFVSPLFGRLIGNGIKKTLPATMDGLKRAAESRRE